MNNDDMSLSIHERQNNEIRKVKETNRMHEMRRKDRQLEDAEIGKILEKNQYGILSTVGQDGMPYGVPLTYIYDKGNIYFHSALEGHKLDNIAYSKKASFCVVGSTEILPGQFSTRYESVIAFGEIHELKDEEKETVLLKVVERYSEEYIEKGMKYIKGAEAKARVFYLKVDKITGKARR